MSYESKLEGALAIVESHNSSLGEDAEKINAENFVAKLKEMGGTSEQALSACTWEDLQDCGLPRILARSVANTFRAEEKDQKIVIVDDDPVKHAARCKPDELVDKYDPEDSNNPYGERLSVLSKGERILVFNDNGSFNTDATKNELQRIRDGRKGREQVGVDGVILKTYQVGNRPGRYVDEHPLFKGVPLESNGNSANGIAWGDIPFGIRQLTHIAVNMTDELDPNDDEEIDIFEKLDGKDWAKCAARYPQAAVQFKSLKNLGDLPKLKVELGENGPIGVGGHPNDPFREDARRHQEY